ncbi:MAG: DUF4392 domain-containing protein [Planctomycetaceae bacterium]|nr:DUF4392 domain-containing protein [Planctomycetaceae bacterium]
MAELDQQLAAIEASVRVDPARRGLLSNAADTPLGLGELAAAARDLAGHGRDVAIVTGFAIPTTSGPLPETDGPPGAALLADICRQLGMRVRLVTDALAQNAVRIAARHAGLPVTDVEACPLDPAAAADWCTGFLDRSPDLTHLIAIERPGPNHTAESIFAVAGRDACDDFCALVAASDRDACHNMRGENIGRHTAPLHLLFKGAKVRRPDGVKVHRSKGAKAIDSAPNSSHLHTFAPSHSFHSIGIGDGGNEIGMGKFSWEALPPLIAGGHGRRIACRIATDACIISGTSNWGAFALGAALAMLRDRPELIAAWTAQRHLDLLVELVEHGPAVDGVTRERTATVDGLPFLTYIQPWETIRGTWRMQPA